MDLKLKRLEEAVLNANAGVQKQLAQKNLDKYLQLMQTEPLCEQGRKEFYSADYNCKFILDENEQRVYLENGNYFTIPELFSLEGQGGVMKSTVLTLKSAFGGEIIGVNDFGAIARYVEK